MDYTPNFEDKRVLNRLFTAYAFTRAYVHEDKSDELAKVLLDKKFGQQQNPLSAYLRNKLLICTKEWYSMSQGIVKEYTLNVPGALFLRDILIKSGYIQDHISRLSYAPVKAKANTLPEQEPELEVPLLSGDTFDKKIALIWVQREFETELSSLNFTYEDKKSRWWHLLQNVKSSIRSEVLANAGLIFDYDIETCAPTLIHQHAAHLGLDEYLFGIRDYINNKDDFRLHLSSMINIGTAEYSLKLAKVIVNSLFTGAEIAENGKKSIFALVNFDKRVIRKFKNDARLTALRADIKKCWQVIEPSLGFRYNQNKNGKWIKERLIGKRKAMCYFDLERKVMMTVRKFLELHQYKFFLIHDGWGCDRQINREELADFVLQETGFKVTFKETKF